MIAAHDCGAPTDRRVEDAEFLESLSVINRDTFYYLCLNFYFYCYHISIFIDIIHYYCDVCPCLSMSVEVCRGLSMSVHVCPSLSVSVHVCPCLLRSVEVCPCLSISVDVTLVCAGLVLSIFSSVSYQDRKSTRLNSSHVRTSRMPSSAWKKKKKKTTY